MEFAWRAGARDVTARRISDLSRPAGSAEWYVVVVVVVIGQCMLVGQCMCQCMFCQLAVFTCGSGGHRGSHRGFGFSFASDVLFWAAEVVVLGVEVAILWRRWCPRVVSAPEIGGV